MFPEAGAALLDSLYRDPNRKKSWGYCEWLFHLKRLIFSCQPPLKCDVGTQFSDPTRVIWGVERVGTKLVQTTRPWLLRPLHRGAKQEIDRLLGYEF